MKKIYLVIITIVSFWNASLAQTLTHKWTGVLNGSTINTTDIGTDSLGNVYVAGFFNGTQDFDLGAGTFNLTSVGFQNAFLAKYDANKNFIWAQKVTGTAGQGSTAREVFVKGNYVYFACSASGVTDINPGPGVDTRTLSGTGTACVIKMDLAGNYIWGSIYGTNAFSDIGNVVVDNANNVYYCGRGGGGTYGGFLKKVNSSGVNVWTVNLFTGPPTQGVVAFSCAVDAVQDVYVTGNFNYPTNFGGGTINPSGWTGSTGWNTIFLAKYNSAGAFVYVKSVYIGGSMSLDLISYDITDHTVMYDPVTNSIILNGMYGGTCDFDFGPGTVNLTGGGHYIVKYDLLANLIWAKGIKPPLSGGQNIALDNSGNIYFTAAMTVATASMNPLLATATNTRISTNSDIMLARYSSAGVYSLAVNLGSGNSFCDGGLGVCSVNGSEIYISGDFNQTIDFDPTLGVANSTVPFWSSYFAKYTYCTTAPSSPPSISGNTVICSGSSNTYSVALVAGATSYTWALPGGWTGTSTTNIITTTANVSGGSITVASKNACGTSTLTTLIVSVGTPTVTANASNSVICNGGIVTLTGGGATSYTWSGGVTDGIAFSPTATANYTVTGTSGGCSNTANITVTVNPSPTVTISGGSLVCSGNSINLTANGASTYTWNTGPTTASIAVSPTVNTTYTVTGTNLQGCNNTATKSVTVNPLPTVIANTSNSVICGPPFQGTATLTGSGGLTYTWNPGGAGTSIAVSPSVTSTYTVTGTDANGCVNSVAITQSVSLCTGTQQLLVGSSELVVYPNPTSGHLVIASEARQSALIQVYNALGSMIYSAEIKETKTEINLSEYSNGIYFIRIGDQTKKIIKE